jgi:hypothetical protein
MLARVYRAGDGDCGICFEYAVHDAVQRRDGMVIDRVEEVLTKFCKIKGDEPESILFGAEKTGSQQLIETAKELLTSESVLLYGTRGRPVLLKKHIDSAAREFRKKGVKSALPQSISGLWKADLFLGKSDADKWVGITVKVNPSDLEGARGLRVGIVPATGQRDAAVLDEQRNLIICPLPYDGAFMETFYRGWGIVQQFLADAKMPKPVALPVAADRRLRPILSSAEAFPLSMSSTRSCRSHSPSFWKPRRRKHTSPSLERAPMLGPARSWCHDPVR